MDNKDLLPPFVSLRVFEAAARSGSFARAAEELGISAGAVSQHIRTIEEFAGQPLFPVFSWVVLAGLVASTVWVRSHFQSTSKLEVARWSIENVWTRISKSLASSSSHS